MAPIEDIESPEEMLQERLNNYLNMHSSVDEARLDQAKKLGNAGGWDFRNILIWADPDRNKDSMRPTLIEDLNAVLYHLEIEEEQALMYE